MHIDNIDLNLLRLFDAVYQTGNVSRAAERLNLTQPTASQGIARLRLLLDDALFERTAGGVRPSPRAQRLAPAIRSALATIEQAFSEHKQFNPMQSHRTFNLHMSDIGEGRFLPSLMPMLRAQAPHVRIETQYVEPALLADALDTGRVNFAFGFLPNLKGTQNLPLLDDRYVVLLRRAHFFAQEKRAKAQALSTELSKLEFVAARTHADTTRILRSLDLEDRLRLTVDHFTVLPAIVRATDLAAVVPYEIAAIFSSDDYGLIELDLPMAHFTVSLHWSKRFESEPGNCWFHGLVMNFLAKPRPSSDSG
jgi:DNA-binding transcriptional LysR family regulator